MDASRDDFVIAIRSAFLKKGNQQRFSLLSLIVFSIIFLALGSFNLKIINFSRSIIKEIIYVSSFIVSVPENIVKESFYNVSDHFKYYEDYELAKDELQELKNKDLSKKIITFENKELKKLIDDYFVEDSQTYAKVLMDKESPFLRSIVINKGSKNGVKTGMIVYDDIYLVGKIVEVNFQTSRVLLISDINSKIPVTIQPLDIQGIMSGLDKRKGKLQYIRGEKLIKKKNEELIVVTSGSGAIFKSGTPIGKIDSADIQDSNEIIVNFYRDFSQLKYVRISSYMKEIINLDQTNKKNFKTNNSVITKIKNLEEDINLFQKQKIINDKIRAKLEIENIELKKNIVNTQKKLAKQNNTIIRAQNKNEKIRFLELNLLYGHKCRKSFLKPNLYKISTEEYKNCVLRNGRAKKN